MCKRFLRGLSRLVVAVVAAVLLSSCSAGINTSAGESFTYSDTRALYELPFDMRDKDLYENTKKHFGEYLKGKSILLDPGHGGEDRRNVSLKKLVVEADVNLKVALHLKDFLEEAGVKVLMTRFGDETVALQERSKMANESKADLFLSLHHNAPATTGDFWTNFTSTYYHATPDDYEYEPSEHDLARYIQRDLAYAVGNSGGLGSFDGTYSDYLRFPGEGYHVLREVNIPSVLVECAFHTNRFEEARLNIDEFNKIEAWGIFKGIGKYYETGVPIVNYLREQSSFVGGKLLIFFAVHDPNGIDPNSVCVYFDREPVDFIYDDNTGKIEAEVSNILSGEHEVRVVCANLSGNHSLPYHKKILVK